MPYLTNLEHLALDFSYGKNVVVDKAMKELCMSLRDCKKLIYLDLDFSGNKNWVTDAGLEFLTIALN